MTDLDEQKPVPVPKPHQKTDESGHVYAVSQLCYTVSIIFIAVVCGSVCLGKYLLPELPPSDAEASTPGTP